MRKPGIFTLLLCCFPGIEVFLVRILGIPDTIVEHGTPEELHRECGYDAQAIKEAVPEMMRGKIAVSASVSG